jgi:hypothetical protein
VRSAALRTGDGIAVVRHEGLHQAAEKLSRAVILSGAKDVGLCIFMAMRDSSSPAAPQNDSPDGFFPSLFMLYYWVDRERRQN